MKNAIIAVLTVLIYCSCSKDEPKQNIKIVSYKITANYQLDNYSFEKTDDRNKIYYRNSNPEFVSAVTKQDNGIMYTFYTYGGVVELDKTNNNYTVRLPSTTIYRIVTLEIDGKSYNFRGGIPVVFKL